MIRLWSGTGETLLSIVYDYVTIMYYKMLESQTNNRTSIHVALGTGHKVQVGVGYEKLGVGHYFLTR